MKIFAVFNIKGGVGKTASTVNLSYLSALRGARTLVWDLDPQAATTFYFRIKPKRKGGNRKLIEGKRDLASLIKGTDFGSLDLLRARFSFRNLDLELADVRQPVKRLARLIKPVAKSYEHLFFDCPPGLTLTSKSVLFAADYLLVPTIPTVLSLRTLEQLQEFMKTSTFTAPRILPFFSMVDRRRALHRNICERAKSLPFDFLEAEIPYSADVEKMGLMRAPVLEIAAGGKAARAYAALWNELENFLAPGAAREV